MITDINLRHKILLTILTTTLREFEEKKLEINSGGGERVKLIFENQERSTALFKYNMTAHANDANCLITKA